MSENKTLRKSNITDEAFIEAVKTSFSIAEVLRKLNVEPHGSSNRVFKNRAGKLNLDLSHFTGRGHLKGKTHNYNEVMSLDVVMIADSSHCLNESIKKRIINDGLLINECVKCKTKNIWNNKPITLHFDHINGNSFDHRLENLRILCPNCHSQTKTYKNKNNIKDPNKINNKSVVKRRIKKENKCEICLIECCPNSKYCIECFNSNRKELQTKYEYKTKIEWPSTEELINRANNTSFLQVGRELGVSDNAVRKRIKKHPTNKMEIIK